LGVGRRTLRKKGSAKGNSPIPRQRTDTKPTIKRKTYTEGKKKRWSPVAPKKKKKRIRDDRLGRGKTTAAPKKKKSQMKKKEKRTKRALPLDKNGH